MNDEVKTKAAEWKPWLGWLAVAVVAAGFWHWQAGPKLLWKIELGAPVMSAPAASEDAVYVCVTNALKAFNGISGKELWRFSHDYPYMAGPPLLMGRNVFVWSSKLYALNKETGDEMWHDLAQEVFCAGGGNVVYGGWQSVRARDAATGRDRWAMELNRSQMVQGLSVYGDTVLVGFSLGDEQTIASRKKTSSLGGMEAWDFEGKARLWSADLGSAILHGPVKINDLVFCVTSGSRGRSLVAYDTGAKEIRWRVRTGNLVLPELANVSTQTTDVALGTMTEPVAFKDMIVAGISDEYDDFIKSYTAETGVPRWSYEIEWTICRESLKEQQRSALTGPVIEGDNVYFGAGPYLVKLSAETGKCRWRFKTDNESFIRQKPAIKNGIVYFGSDDGCLYGVRDCN
jgi:outer membrane protein assembly factor BamB